ncbi:ribulokinase [Pelagicoccus mobilis]|uniref:Ribulokinase n=1 Tax=Pelagicoccus mobilis TaxID=415221 RepID=A0A934RT22_9BACT|nr:ribulokinase [Pelagicoccus mobilis]MBK1876347.1 ribulokinase [Pelagicoccus mobilis]
MKFSIGLDFGTNSVRCLIVRTDGEGEVSSAVVNYPSGHQGILLDSSDHHLARQSPADYLSSLEKATIDAIAAARETYPDFDPANVIGIGVDTTGSSPMPVDEKNQALAEYPKWKDNLAAQCWLWKDHTSYEEAAKITEIAGKERPQYLAKCGDTYSSEWWWSKIWHCLNVAPEVFDAAYSWVEIADWIPSQLAGVSDPKQVKRGVCAAGHKAFYADEWGGLPDKEFLAMLDPKIADLSDRLYAKAHDASETAGTLSAEWATRLGLPEGIPLAIGEFDVHYGAIGCGVEEGTLVKVIGTSTCDCAVVKASGDVPDVPGICGIVRGSILPGYFGVEAGQSAVGDLFKWWVEGVCQGDDATHIELTEEAAKLSPGQSGLLALDWNNGNRTILVDQRLTGLVLGQTLHTSRAEIYRALIEATAFGARMILERISEYGIAVDKIVCAGGIAEKNAMLMQIYADITGREMRVSASSQACALGAAIGAAVVAGAEAGGFDDFESAQSAMVGVKPDCYKPDPERHAQYNRLFALYKKVHDNFGGVEAVDLAPVMKELLDIKEGK